MKIAIDIHSCSECPYSERKLCVGWICKKNNTIIKEETCKMVSHPAIPSWCPAALETILTDKEEKDFNSTVHA